MPKGQEETLVHFQITAVYCHDDLGLFNTIEDKYQCYVSCTAPQERRYIGKTTW